MSTRCTEDCVGRPCWSPGKAAKEKQPFAHMNAREPPRFLLVVRSARGDCKSRYSGHAGGPAGFLSMPTRGNPPGVAEATPHFHGHRDRLRTRFMEAGSEAL